MALRNPPSWLEGGEHPAENDRLLVAGLLQYVGVSGPDAFKVTAGPGLQVTVAPGGAFVAGTVRSNQGVYHVFNDAPVSLALTTAPTSNPRIDAVVVVVSDADVAGGDNSVELQVIEGIPASNPILPTIPDNALLLAAVSVGVNATGIVSANVSDRRGSRASSLGGVLVCTSTTRPTGPWVGTNIYETDTKIQRVWSGTAWLVVADTNTIPTVFNPPRVYAYASSPTTLQPNGYRTVNLQSTYYDSASMHSNTTNNSRLTAPISGLYHVSAHAYINTSDTGLRRIAISKNGDQVAVDGDTLTTSSPTLLSVEADVPMNAGQYLEMSVYQAAGNNLNITVGRQFTYMSARWVAPLA